MLKESIKVISLTFLISFTVSYLALSFILLNLNLASWSNLMRTILIIVSLVVTIGVGIKYVFWLAKEE